MPTSLAQSKPSGNKNLNPVSYYVNMDEMTQHRKRRLQSLIDSAPFNGSQKDFAAAVDVNKSRVSQMLDPEQPFGERAAKNISMALGLGHRHFEEGFDLDSQEGKNQSPTLPNTVNLSSSALVVVPHLQKEEAGMYEDFLNGNRSPQSNPEVWVSPPSLQGIEAFSVTVDDDVMEPLLPIGCRAIIGVGVPYRSGDRVFVRTGATWMIRRLIIDGESLYLDAPRTQAKAMTGEIVGPVISVNMPTMDVEERMKTK